MGKQMERAVGPTQAHVGSKGRDGEEEEAAFGDSILGASEGMSVFSPSLVNC